jgi:hypothetical protein
VEKLRRSGFLIAMECNFFFSHISHRLVCKFQRYSALRWERTFTHYNTGVFGICCMWRKVMFVLRTVYGRMKAGILSVLWDRKHAENLPISPASGKRTPNTKLLRKPRQSQLLPNISVPLGPLLTRDWRNDTWKSRSRQKQKTHASSIGRGFLKQLSAEVKGGAYIY